MTTTQIIVLIAILVVLVVLLALAIKIVKQYERGVVLRFGRLQRSGNLGQIGLREQHLAMQPRQVETRLGAERLGDALHGRAFAVVLQAVGEGGHQGDGEDGAGFLCVHR